MVAIRSRFLGSSRPPMRGGAVGAGVGLVVAIGSVAGSVVSAGAGSGADVQADIASTSRRPMVAQKVSGRLIRDL